VLLPVTECSLAIHRRRRVHRICDCRLWRCFQLQYVFTSLLLWSCSGQRTWGGKYYSISSTNINVYEDVPHNLSKYSIHWGGEIFLFPQSSKEANIQMAVIQIQLGEAWGSRTEANHICKGVETRLWKIIYTILKGLTWCCNSTKSCNLGTMATQWLVLNRTKNNQRRFDRKPDWM